MATLKLNLLVLVGLLAATDARKVARVDKVVVSMGNDGTDDDVRLQISTEDWGTVKTCTTPVLNSWLGNDWSSGDVEEWDEDFIGDCYGFLLYDDQVWVTLMLADGYDGFTVNTVKVEATYTEVSSYETTEYPNPWYYCTDDYYLSGPTRSVKHKCRVG